MAIHLQGVSYRYAGAPGAALHDVNLQVDSGQVVGLVGPNDAGKTTTCLAASGLAPVVIGGTLTGDVLIDGLSSRSLGPHDIATRCGILFQNPLTQLSGTTSSVWEEVAFGPRNLGLDLRSVVERVETALATIGIGAIADRNPERLSGGQAQLVALASVLALRPTTLILDEPTSLLDPFGTRLVGDVLERIAGESGVAIILVEHKTELLARLSNRIAVMRDGRITLEGPAADILADPALEEAGVEMPAGVRIRRAAAAAGASALLESVDLGPVPITSRLRPIDAAERSGGAARPVDPNPAIELDGIGFTYPSGTDALRGVDLAVSNGERVALVGQNGSGKSTLVRHLNGLLRPTRGVVRINGRDVGRRHVADLAHDVGLAFQNPDRQVFARRVHDEVAFGPKNIGLADVDEAVAAALELLGLRAAALANPFDLGFSNRKLLTIASVVAMQTPIVVLDEPTTGQDIDGVRRVGTAVTKLHDAGRIVLTISHDMRFVAERFDRVVVLREGRVVLDAPTTSAFDEVNWPILASTNLEPPLASVIGARLGLAGTPTVPRLIDAMRAKIGSS